VVARIASTSSSAATLLTAPIIDRRADGDDWAIFVDKSVLTNATRQILAGQLATELPDNIKIEEPPTAKWTFENGRWGISIIVGLVAIDSCPALIGDDVDMSIELSIRIDLDPNPDTGQLLMTLHLSHDVSDWDTFRCALQSIVGLLLASMVPNPVISHNAIFLLTLLPELLIAASIFVDQQAGATIADQTLGGFTKQSTPDEDDDATFTQNSRLPTLLEGAITGARVESAGLVVRGSAPFLVPGQHVMRLEPKSLIPGEWFSDYHCGQATWDAYYECKPVRVMDTVQVLGETLANPKVTLFSTTEVRPAGQWSRTLSSGAAAFVQVEPLDDPQAGATGRLYIHSSAGLARIDIAPVSAVPKTPSALQLAEMKAQCQKAVAKWQPAAFDVRWLVDPPPWEFGAVYRQWLIEASVLATGSTIDVAAIGAGAALGRQAVGRDQAVAIELVTAATQTLRVTVGGLQEVAGRISQRLLLPIGSVELKDEIITMSRTGTGALGVLTSDRIAIVQTDGTLLGMQASRRAAGLAWDAFGLISWGPLGAFRVTARSTTVITEQAVHAAQRAANGEIKIHCAEGQLLLRGARVIRVTEKIKAPANVPRRSITLGRDTVAAAIGSQVIVARPWGAKREVHAT
jgi:hypothetical protein